MESFLCGMYILLIFFFSCSLPNIKVSRRQDKTRQQADFCPGRKGRGGEGEGEGEGESERRTFVYVVRLVGWLVG
ncbi:hypothetical protein GE21DRAFT_1021036 [Neurospora crassa]|nr:hypothetical protein GE21DRAFT_1021036 [Neurospora crassa]